MKKLMTVLDSGIRPFRMGIGRIFAMVVAICSVGQLFAATDGTFVTGGKWSSTSIWKDGIVAGDGGKVTGSLEANATLNVDAEGVTVGGICWPARDLTLTGSDLFFTGDVEIFAGSTFWPKNASLDGQEEATLRFLGGGGLYFDNNGTLMTNFVSVTHSSGSTMRSYSGNPFLTAGTFVFNNGVVQFQTQAAAGTAVLADFAIGKDAKVTVQRGANKLLAEQRNAASLVFHTGSLDVREGGTLMFGVTSGKTLGADTKIIPSSAPVCDGTLVTPALVQDNLGFLTWSETDGLRPFDGYVTDLASASVNDVVKLAATASLNANKTVKSLALDNSAGLTFSNDAVLTVGDGTNPASIVLLRPNYAAVTIAGAGAIDFGASPAYIWAWGSTKSSENRSIAFNVPIKGVGPLTFGNNNKTIQLNFNVVNPDLKGPLYFNLAGGRIFSGVSGGGDPFPNVSDIYLMGGHYQSIGSQLFAFSCVTQHLHVAGYGNPGGSDEYGVINCGGAGAASEIQGPVTLEAPSEFHSQGGTLTLNGPIDGRGDLRLYGKKADCTGSIELHGANSYVGDTDVNVKDLKISGPSPFGTGRVTISSATVVTPTANVTVANDIASGGELVVPSGVRADFKGNAEMSSVTVSRGGTLGVGARFVPEALTAPYGAMISAATSDAVIALNTVGADQKLEATLTGDIELEKLGAGTLTLAAPSTHTGTTIKEGTLKISNSISSPLDDGLVLWLDAFDATTFTTNTQGKVSEWRSRVGSLKMSAATDDDRFGQPTLTTGWNELPAVRFDGDNMEKLIASATFTAQTIFFAFRSTKYFSMAGLWGHGGDNYGIRMGGSESSGTWSVATSGNWCFMDVNPFIDGVQTSSFSFGEPHVMRSVREAGAITPSTALANRWCLGSYYNKDKTSNYGRPWSGDLAEVIVYNRKLTVEECRLVENYLSRKWQQKDIYDIPAPLDKASEVAVGDKGTLDLNGLDVTLASLAGEGTIVNTADSNATLTVTDAATFRGRISGKITLKTPAGADLRVYLTDGAKLVTSGGTIGGYAPDVPSEGIAFWLDAARTETVQCAADGEVVTNWLSRVGTTRFGALSGRALPLYQPTGMDGKPALYFGATNGWTALEQSAATDVGTVFIVYRADGMMQASCAGILGVYGIYDGGIRLSTSTEVQWVQQPGYAFDETDFATLDGVNVQRPAKQVSAAADETHVLSVRRESMPLMGRTCCLGGYFYQKSERVLKGWIAEVIVYDRVLSAAEEARVNAYLITKWRTAGTLDPKYAKNAIGGTLQVDVIGGTIPDEAVPTAVGKLDLSQTELFVNGIEFLDAESDWAVLKGETVGDFRVTNVTEPWRLRYRRRSDGRAWTLGRAKGLFIMVK